ncbi:flocculation protein FLO11-like [Leptopilina heterotoma]|uniref:flocculation protein FLO11-like n=1 Tax=Leptopilina heterotoma TaxID=63436 RepID=UPI001CAA24FE|nr:flocculation protein FLO11-like [Leptopilina heterotoma]
MRVLHMCILLFAEDTSGSYSIDWCKKKILSLRASYRREKKKEKESKGTGKGGDEVYQSRWFAYEAMRFLNDKDKPRKRLNTEQTTELDKVSDNEDVNIEKEDDSNSMTNIQVPISQPQTPHPQALTPQPSMQQTPTSQAPISRKRRRGENNDNMICECLTIMRNASSRLEQQNSNSLTTIFGNLVMGKMNTYSKRTRQLVKSEIYNILAKADQGYYDNLSSNTQFNISQTTYASQTNIPTFFPSYPPSTTSQRPNISFENSSHFQSYFPMTPTTSSYSPSSLHTHSPMTPNSSYTQIFNYPSESQATHTPNSLNPDSRVQNFFTSRHLQSYRFPSQAHGQPHSQPHSQAHGLSHSQEGMRKTRWKGSVPRVPRVPVPRAPTPRVPVPQAPTPRAPTPTPRAPSRHVPTPKAATPSSSTSSSSSSTISSSSTSSSDDENPCVRKKTTPKPPPTGTKKSKKS